MQEKIESFGYKLWNTEKQLFSVTKQYQKQVDDTHGWLGVPLCKTNDKLFLNIKETKSNFANTTIHSWSISLSAENDNEQWCELKVHMLKEEDLENMLTFENKLRKMWIAFN